MIDYLFMFTDEAQAQDTLSEWVTSGGTWRGKEGCGVMPVKILLADAVIDVNDVDGVTIITDAVYSSYYWVAIACPAVDNDLWAIPQCVHEVDRHKSAPGSVEILRTKLTQQQIDSALKVKPIFAGSIYF